MQAGRAGWRARRRRRPTSSCRCPTRGVFAALGYARESGLPFEIGLIRNHYVGRTFIEPKQSIRHFGVRIKLNPVREILEGKRVVLVDDSIVRGTTSRKIVKMVRDAGAAEVHLRISCPPTVWPCYYGIDTPTREELIAASHTVEEIREYHRRRQPGLPVARRHAGGGWDGAPESSAPPAGPGDYPVAIGEQRPERARSRRGPSEE